MARLKNYTRSLASGYLLLGVNIAYSLAMVPLALTYLSKPVFGIWAVVVQIGIFLQLTDLGMTGAFSRILIDYKDRPDVAEFAAVTKTMWMVFCLQGVLVALLGWLTAPWISRAFDIGPEERDLFTQFLKLYLLVFGLSLGTKVFSQVLFAQQRSDLISLAAVAGLVIGFAVLWVGFRTGLGLWAMAVSFGVTTLWNGFFNMLQALRIGMLPRGLLQARWSKQMFLEVFDYGKDRFLVSVGFSVLQSAPTFLVTRFLGLESARVNKLQIKRSRCRLTLWKF